MLISLLSGMWRTGVPYEKLNKKTIVEKYDKDLKSRFNYCGIFGHLEMIIWIGNLRRHFELNLVLVGKGAIIN